jgi:hypothetical protein
MVLSAIFGFIVGCLCSCATRRYSAIRRMKKVEGAETDQRASAGIQGWYGLQELHQRTRSYDSLPRDIWPERVLIVTNPDRNSKVGNCQPEATVWWVQGCSSHYFEFIFGLFRQVLANAIDKRNWHAQKSNMLFQVSVNIVTWGKKHGTNRVSRNACLEKTDLLASHSFRLRVSYNMTHKIALKYQT